MTDDTLVVFLNDNGGPIYTKVQSNGPLRLGKLFLFDGGVRVPMIVKWPKRARAGFVFDGMSSSLDLFPTVCAAAGIEVPSTIELDGTDLLPYLNGDVGGAPHDRLFWSNGPNIAVRNGDWKLIKSHENVWLFDLSEDVGEKNNLAGRRPDMVQQLEKEHADWKAQMRPPAWPSKPNRRKIPVDDVTYEMNI